MDILAQYEKENPKQEQAPQNMYDDQSEEYGAIIRLVMKVSGGKIQGVRQANMVLIVAAGIMIITTLMLLFGLPGSSAPTIPLLRSAHPDIIVK
ncbi:MAG: hypothetical protein AAB972_02320 [Patescibacteria group bacterium]